MERTTALALPDEQQFKTDIQAINQFQKVVRANMVDGQDYGIIPGTSKPTLLKPGAEKIAKLLGLADQYEILDKGEDWERGFFRYLIKCSLNSVATGVTIAEGLGECNSKESKYAYRWVGERDLPSGTDKTKLVSQVRYSKSGGKWTVYRFDNEDIFSQVNTILKMAKKRALVDAALSAGRLSQVFTQDIEDMAVIHDEPKATKPTTSAVKKQGKGNLPKSPETPPDIEQAEEDAEELFPPNPPNASAVAVKPEPEPIEEPIDMDWLKESLKKLSWQEKTVTTFLTGKYKVEGGLLKDVLPRLTKEQRGEFVKEIQDRLDML